MERIDRWDCIVSMAIMLSISLLTVWGYSRDTSLYVNVKPEDATVTANAK
ncbi:MAG: hypothetical protein J7641_20390 [Cyanobacteria bacterium SID2]|nr:hypothetical protein [Cyanobacteria bacterium SID2]MBP0003528.1 hypothetical protein [Cyanobacteria bacterium SBC]